MVEVVTVGEFWVLQVVRVDVRIVHICRGGCRFPVRYVFPFVFMPLCLKLTLFPRLPARFLSPAQIIPFASHFLSTFQLLDELIFYSQSPIILALGLLTPILVVAVHHLLLIECGLSHVRFVASVVRYLFILLFLLICTL